MGLHKDIRAVVSGFTGLFTSQDVIDALPGYKRNQVLKGFQFLIWNEGIAEDTTPLRLYGLFRVVNGNERVRRNSRSTHPISIDGVQYESEVAGCRAMGWSPKGLSDKFSRMTSEAGYTVYTIDYHGHSVTRSYN